MSMTFSLRITGNFSYFLHSKGENNLEQVGCQNVLILQSLQLLTLVNSYGVDYRTQGDSL